MRVFRCSSVTVRVDPVPSRSGDECARKLSPCRETAIIGNDPGLGCVAVLVGGLLCAGVIGLIRLAVAVFVYLWGL